MSFIEWVYLDTVIQHISGTYLFYGKTRIMFDKVLNQRYVGGGTSTSTLLLFKIRFILKCLKYTSMEDMSS